MYFLKTKGSVSSALRTLFREIQLPDCHAFVYTIKDVLTSGLRWTGHVQSIPQINTPIRLAAACVGGIWGKTECWAWPQRNSIEKRQRASKESIMKYVHHLCCPAYSLCRHHHRDISTALVLSILTQVGHASATFLYPNCDKASLVQQNWFLACLPGTWTPVAVSLCQGAQTNKNKSSFLLFRAWYSLLAPCPKNIVQKQKSLIPYLVGSKLMHFRGRGNVCSC